MKIGYLCDLDTTISDCPFFLLKQRGKQVQISWMDANLIRVAPECRDTSGIACPYRGALGWEVYLSMQLEEKKS
jgi:hypothetical protein